MRYSILVSLQTAMLYPGSHVIFSLITISYFVNGEALVKEHDKSFERDFQICMDNFVVHTNMIIRTQDSRKMGAKYLNEMDVDSRQECKRFCCETDTCDVFIFEEKKPSSCYLFHCGAPHDFKCKFTNHTNYSSAVLTITPQSSIQLEEQIHRTQQEHELKSLRKLSEHASSEYTYTESPAALPTQISKISILTTPAVKKPACSRNQYECRATKDCIAIYNVCDGIPQCADGSDESADLGCPTEKPTASPQLLVQKPLLPLLPDIANYQQILQHRKPYAPMYERPQEQDGLKEWQIPNSLHQMVPQQQGIQYPGDRVMLSQPQINFGGFQRYQWDYPPYYGQSNEVYGNLNIPHGPSKLSAYEQDPSRIFHHKRPGVISEAGERDTYIEPNRPYVPYYLPSSHEIREEDQQPKTAPQPELLSAAQPEPPPQSRRKQLQELRPSEVPPRNHNQIQKSQNEVKSTCAPHTCNDTNSQERSNKVIQKAVENSNKAAEVPKEKDDVKPVDASKNENQKVHRHSEDMTHNHVIEHYKKTERKALPVAEHFRQSEEEDERIRPRGAVISLALGLTVTAIMAVLIACRLRVVRRRGRRGHDSFAHDADYLVNGMYL